MPRMTKPAPRAVTVDAPHNVEAERAVIGACLIADAFPLVSGTLTPPDFFLLKHQYIWSVINDLHRAGQPVEVLAVHTRLAELRLTEAVPVAYLVEVLNATPSAANVEFYARVVKNASQRRALMHAADAMKALAMDEQRPTDAVLSEASGMLTRLIVPDERASVPYAAAAETVMAAFLDDMEAVSDGRAPQTAGLPSGLPTLTRAIGGYIAGHLGVIAANTGEGKSAFMVQEAVHLARRGVRVLYVNLEMTAADQAERIITQESGLSMRAMRARGAPNPHDLRKVMHAHNEIKAIPLIFHDGSFMSLPQLEAVIASHVARHHVEIVFVDYLTLITSPTGGTASTADNIAEKAATVKNLAKKYAVPIVTAAQMNRTTAQNPSVRPSMHWIQGSAGIAQNADWVGIIHRPDYREDPAEREAVEDAHLILGKVRHGAPATIDLLWLSEFAKFAEKDLRRA